jgi:hypothetical protein
VPLEGPQKGELRDALRGAFIRRHKLKVLLEEKLSKNLDDISDSRQRGEDYDNLVSIAASEGWWEELLICTSAQVPNHRVLRQCVDNLLPKAHPLIEGLPRWWKAHLGDEHARKCYQVVLTGKISFEDDDASPFLPILVGYAWHLLKEWGKERFDEFARQMDALTRGDQLPRKTEEPLHVMVLVKRMHSSKQYHVRSWWVRGRGQPEPKAEKDCRTEEEVREFFVKIWNQAAENVAINTVRFEFILPQGALDLDVDQWKVRREPKRGQPKGGWRVLGFMNPVIVRPLERMEDDFLRNLVVHRWHHAVQPANGSRVALAGGKRAGSGALLVVSNPVEAGTLFCKAYQNERLACTVLCYALGSRWQGKAPETLRQLIEAGLPVVLWLRQQPELPLTRLIDLLEARTPCDLPEAIWRLRQEAASADPNHLGHHVVLLFEDPARQPLRTITTTTPLEFAS